MLLETRIPFTFLFRKVRWELLIISFYALFIEYLDEYLHFSDLSIPLSIPAMLGTTLALILGFRTNQAYDRWWEARKIWGAIVNDSRTLIRQVISYTSSGEGLEDKEIQRLFANRQIAWCFSLSGSLRGTDVSDEVDSSLNTADLEFIQKQSNQPNAILQLHGETLGDLGKREVINALQQAEMDKTLARLTDAMGKCERIKKTVFPKPYSLFIDFVLYVFIILLPFGIIEFFGLIEALITISVAIPFVLLEKTAYLMQDPFDNAPTDTPVLTISSTIKRNLLEMVGSEDIQLQNYNYGYYEM